MLTTGEVTRWSITIGLVPKQSLLISHAFLRQILVRATSVIFMPFTVH
jgi:hypothetical protein